MSDWPKHPNGENKTVGEMSRDERKRVMDEARDRFFALGRIENRELKLRLSQSPTEAATEPEAGKATIAPKS